MPPISVLLYSRMRADYGAQYDAVREEVGCGIHELGHATGILGDDNDPGGIIPPHSGTNEANCVMHTGNQPDILTNIVFLPRTH